jgi:hypothetical protein
MQCKTENKIGDDQGGFLHLRLLCESNFKKLCFPFCKRFAKTNKEMSVFLIWYGPCRFQAKMKWNFARDVLNLKMRQFGLVPCLIREAVISFGLLFSLNLCAEDQTVIQQRKSVSMRKH